MTHLLKWEDSTCGREFSAHDELTERERALLRAWDDSNLRLQDDATFEQRLVSLYEQDQAIPLSTRDAQDTEIALLMAADANNEREREEREREERAADEFREIARLHDEYLYGVAVRLSGDRESAKDLVQETLARALLRFGQFKQGTNVRAWLTTILTRLFYDHLKHEKVVTRAGPELMALEIVDHDMTIPRVSDAALWGAVEALEADLRKVIELRYFRQLSYKKIADRLQVPVGTVGTRLMRAHERLKYLLRQQQAA